jgi:hypothetical protein
MILYWYLGYISEYRLSQLAWGKGFDVVVVVVVVVLGLYFIIAS